MSVMQLAELIQVDPSEIVRSLFMKGLVLSMSQVSELRWQPMKKQSSNENG